MAAITDRHAPVRVVSLAFLIREVLADVMKSQLFILYSHVRITRGKNHLEVRRY